ncbi:aminomethyltransferase family protein [Actinoplanes subtropicus]|uniref:aminomethyltransferase family protein n=1 Tax=Actinoplanes subtropicus TaxID=543632 RepID=UPI0007C4A568|nr:aminomethyltransferase family protein [Actinoplanes subtropicus]
MEFTVDFFRVTPPVDIIARLFGQPEYTDWLDESMSWKRTCYIGDWSFIPQTRLRGPQVLDLFSGITVNSFANFRAGASKHAVHTNAHGKIMHEGILTRLDEDDYVYHGHGGAWATYNLDHSAFKATAEPEDWFIYQVAGPAAVPLMQDLTSDEKLLDVPYMHAVPTTLAGHRIWALRQGMAGEAGYELQGPREIGHLVYDAVVEAGRKYGIRRLGARAVPINHLENAIPTNGLEYLPAVFEPEYADYVASMLVTPYRPRLAYITGSFESSDLRDYYRDPVEFGWTRQIKFDHEFLGDAALRRIVANPRRTLRTLVWNSDDVLDVHRSLFADGPTYTFMDMPRDQRGYIWADQIERDGAPVGVSTSRGYSYYYRQMMSLAVLNVADAEPGTRVEVVWGNPGEPKKRIRATVAQAPYKPVGSRGDLRALLAAYHASV